MLKSFQQILEPTIKKSEYELIEDSLKPFFNQTYSKNFDCTFCPENCSPEIFLLDGNLCINCDNEILESPYKIDKERTLRYKFDIRSFCKKVAQVNNIDFLFDKKNNETFYFGSKNIDSIEYQFYYMLDLTRKKQLTDIAIQRIKSLKHENSRLVILTPDNLVQDNKMETLLKENSCTIASLKNCLENKLLIKGCLSVSASDIIHIKNTYELAILSSKEIYIKGQKIECPNQPFLLLDYLAKHPNIAISRDNCIAGSWGDDYVMGDKTLSDNISFIRKGLKNNGLDKNDFIIVRNKTVKLNVRQDKIYIK